MINDFRIPGKASFIVGGQWGSEGKGAAAAWVAKTLDAPFDIYTTNAGCQSGHTSIADGVKRVAFHLPTAPLVAPNTGQLIYLNAGSVIDPDLLMKELVENHKKVGAGQFFIHPNAAVVTDECREAENHPTSAQTRVASTRKGVGEALSRKVLRSALLAKDHPTLKTFVRRIDLNTRLVHGQSALIEIPQGVGLSLNSKFYPHCTSRDCTPAQALSDAQLHPEFAGPTMLVLRTFPIRVGNIDDYSSGDCYPDQYELSWTELGVPAEITTVTGRVRRVFTWSQQQLIDALIVTRPKFIFLTHCDYLKDLNGYHHVTDLVNHINYKCDYLGLDRPEVICSNGSTTDDVMVWGKG